MHGWISHGSPHRSHSFSSFCIVCYILLFARIFASLPLFVCGSDHWITRCLWISAFVCIFSFASFYSARRSHSLDRFLFLGHASSRTLSGSAQDHHSLRSLISGSFSLSFLDLDRFALCTDFATWILRLHARSHTLRHSSVLRTDRFHWIAPGSRIVHFTRLSRSLHRTHTSAPAVAFWVVTPFSLRLVARTGSFAHFFLRWILDHRTHCSSYLWIAVHSADRLVRLLRALWVAHKHALRVPHLDLRLVPGSVACLWIADLAHRWITHLAPRRALTTRARSRALVSPRSRTSVAIVLRVLLDALAFSFAGCGFAVASSHASLPHAFRITRITRIVAPLMHWIAFALFAGSLIARLFLVAHFHSRFLADFNASLRWIAVCALITLLADHVVFSSFASLRSHWIGSRLPHSHIVMPLGSALTGSCVLFLFLFIVLWITHVLRFLFFRFAASPLSFSRSFSGSLVSFCWMVFSRVFVAADTLLRGFA